MSSAAKQRGYRRLLMLVILTITSMVPISISALGIANLQVRELLIPLLFFITAADFAVKKKQINLFSARRGNILGVFVATFLFVILLSYARNPVLPSSLGSGDDIGFKVYWRFLNGLFVYLTATYWINRNRLAPIEVLRALFWVVTAITAMAMFTLMTGIPVPGLDTFAWNVNEIHAIGDAQDSTRIPFLEIFAQVGFFLVLAGAGFGGKLRIPMILYFLVCIYLGGGRVALLSSIAGFTVWLFLTRHFVLTGVIVISGILALASVQILYELAPSPQLKRFARLGSLEESSLGRYYIFKYSIKDFMDNPVFGTGYGKEYDIGYINVRGKLIEPELINKQLRFGSHTTHLQILKNLGLVGYIPFLMIWLYMVYKLLPTAMTLDKRQDRLLVSSAQFMVVLVAALLIRMIVEGNGSELRLYIYMATAGSIINHVIATRQRQTEALRRVQADLQKRPGDNHGVIRRREITEN